MKIGSPNNIEILLHAYVCSREPIPRWDAPAVQEAITMFLALDAIQPTTEPKCYETTPYGAAWVEALCRVEQPRRVYVDHKGEILREHP